MNPESQMTKAAEYLREKLPVYSGYIFYTLGVQYPVRLFFRVFGNRIWSPLAGLTSAVSQLVGKSFSPVLSRIDGEPIEKARKLIDAVEGSVGIQGSWEIKSSSHGIKRISSCPYACRWGEAADFCPTMGQLMGQKALEALFPGADVHYTVRSTLAKGDPFCEYVVDLKSK